MVLKPGLYYISYSNECGWLLFASVMLISTYLSLSLVFHFVFWCTKHRYCCTHLLILFLLILTQWIFSLLQEGILARSRCFARRKIIIIENININILSSFRFFLRIKRLKILLTKRYLLCILFVTEAINRFDTNDRIKTINSHLGKWVLSAP